jgi:uncharacterized protein YdiU (UPF0061 family)
MNSLRFDNRFTRLLPADPEAKNFRRQVKGACYSRVQPTPVPSPRLLAYSREMADQIGITTNPADDEEFLQVFAGNRVLPEMDPFAMCYGGHQFGSWAGQLGDGRAINLGEVVGRDGNHWMLQLKGAGPTPYSRTADGLAVLRSSVREFLCSEAMFHLGVPTTRALSLVQSGQQVMRDMFYDGNARFEPGAVVCRVAPSFTRFGNFQIFAAQQDHENLKLLVDTTIANDFPELGPPSGEVRARWFEEVCLRTATMVVDWMRVGFVHGVMNTDNMSILGLTIDYGPYGWLEDYDPGWTPNTTDAHGKRYAFGQQPKIALWNLLQLANALLPCFAGPEPLQQGLDRYTEAFNGQWQTMMASKLGIQNFDDATDSEIVETLLDILQATETDMTLFFRLLANVDCQTTSDCDRLQPLMEAYYKPTEVVGSVRQRIEAWLESYADRVRRDGTDDSQRREAMNRVNPLFVLRNYLAQLAIDRAEEGDASMIEELLDTLRNPYTEQDGRESWAEKRPEWARHRAGCSMLSCSS